jgi:hypothetical protein
MESLSSQLATATVDIYRNVIQRSGEAMKCRDAEDVLQLAIHAFNWIQRDHASLSEVEESERSVDWEDSIRNVVVMHRVWLGLCPFAHLLIEAQHNRGYAPDNEAEFYACEERAKHALETQSEITGEGLSLEVTEAALTRAASAEQVNLDELLQQASQHFNATFVLPWQSPLSDDAIDQLVNDDQRAFGG